MRRSRGITTAERRAGRRRAGVLLAALVSGGTVTPAAEEQETGEPSGHYREEIQVTARRVEQELGEAPGHVTVITREEIRRSAARSLDGLLRRLAGFGLFRRSGSEVAHPTSQGAFLRGISPSGASRVLVLVDGVPANDPFGGWIPWSRIPLVSIERIEVLRGGGSDAWGSDALGGVIQVITRAAPEGEVDLSAEAGSQGRRSLELLAGRGEEALSWSLTGRIHGPEGYETLQQGQRGPIDVAATSRHRLLRPGLLWSAGRRARLFVRGLWFDEARGNGTPLTGNSTRTAGLEAGAGIETAGGGAWSLTAFVRRQRFGSTFSSQAADRTSERHALDQDGVETTTAGGGLQWTGAGDGSFILSAGGDVRFLEGETREEFFRSGGRFLRERRAGGEQILAGAFVQSRFRPRSRLALSLGLRADGILLRDGSLREVSLQDGSVLADRSFDDAFHGALSPRVDLGYRIGSLWRIRSAAYRGLRAPTINELYRPFRIRNDITEANAGLRPEILTGYEIGADLLSPSASLRVTVFVNHLEDAVANVILRTAAAPGTIPPCGFVPAGGSCAQRLNLDRVTAAGLEAEATVALGRRWSATAAAFLSRGTIRRASGHPRLEGNAVPQSPERRAVLAVEHAAPRGWGARVQATFAGRQYDDAGNTRSLDPYATYDLSAWVETQAGVGLSLAVENVGNRRFAVGETTGGLVTVGAPRRVRLGLRWSPGRPSGGG